jgi:hypothetical protein
MVRASQCFGEKALGGGGIAFGREQEVDRCTLGIHGPIQDYTHLSFNRTYVSSPRQESFVALSPLRKRRSNSGA